MDKTIKEKKKKICVVGYKTGIIKDSGFIYGEIFDELNECCDPFKKWFFSTGNKKVSDFYNSSDGWDTKDGINFVQTGQEFKVELHQYDKDYSNCDSDQIHFCLFCGAKIEIRKTCDVILTPRFKKVQDGYKENKRMG